MHVWPELLAFFQIVLIDISLAGDNAIAVGIAAAGLPAERRHHAVLAGIGAATLLRICFALFAVELLHITGLLAAGGLLLLWVAWKMWREIRHLHRVKSGHVEVSKNPAKKLSAAILQIVLADISMSLDNVLAVAGVARENIVALVSGLALSVFLMGAASAVVARFTARYAWLAYLGIAIVLYTALAMIWDGGHQLAGLSRPIGG